MKKGMVTLFLVLLLVLAAFGAGWKWTHGGPPVVPAAVADAPTSSPDGWTWDG